MRTILGDTQPDGGKERYDRAGFGEASDKIRGRLVARVKSLAATNSFWSQAKPELPLLWFWWGSSDGDAVLAFTDATMETDAGFRGLLRITVNRVRSTSGDYDHVDKKSWSKVANVERLAEKARRILTIGPTPETKELAERFLSALDRDRDSSL